MNAKRWLCLLLTLLMLLSMVPATVIAEDTTEQTATDKDNQFELTEDRLLKVKADYQNKGDLLWLNSIEETETGGKALPDWGYTLYHWLEQELDKALSNETSALVHPYANYPDVKDSYPNGEDYKSVCAIQWFKMTSGTQNTQDEAWTDDELKAYAGAVFSAFLFDRPDAFWFNREFYYVISGDYLGFVIYNPTGNTTTVAPDGTVVKEVRSGFYIHSKKYMDGVWDKTDPLVSVNKIASQIKVLNATLEKIAMEFTGGSKTFPEVKPEEYYNTVHYFYWLLITQNTYNPYASPGGKNVRALADLDAWKSISALVGNTGYDGPTCNGYTTAFKLLCDKVGIPCVAESGTGTTSSETAGGEHIWNYVQIEPNGPWYSVDLTWAYALISKTTYFDNQLLGWATYPFENAESDIRFANSVDGFTEYNSQVNTGTEYEKWFLIGTENTTSEFLNGKITQLTPTNIAHRGHGVFTQTQDGDDVDRFYWNGRDNLAGKDYNYGRNEEEQITIDVFHVPNDDIVVRETADTDGKMKKVFDRNISFQIQTNATVKSAGLLVFDNDPIYHNIHTAKQVIPLVTEGVTSGEKYEVTASGINADYLRNGIQLCLYFEMEGYAYAYSKPEEITACQHDYVDDLCRICGNFTKYYLVVEKRNESTGVFDVVETVQEEQFFVPTANENRDDLLVAQLQFRADSDCRVSLKSPDGSYNFRAVGTPHADDGMVAMYRQDIRKQENCIESSGLYLAAGQNVTLTLTKYSDLYLMLGYECDRHVYKEKVIKEATCQAEGEKVSRCFKCGAIDKENTGSIEKVEHAEGEYCEVCTDAKYCIFGCINGKNVAVWNNGNSTGKYCFTEDNGNKVTILSGTQSQIAVKTTDNTQWFMAEGDPLTEDNGVVSVLLKPVTQITQKRYTLTIPAMTAVEVTLVEMDAQTLKLSYRIIDELEMSEKPSDYFNEGYTEYRMKSDPSRSEKISIPVLSHTTTKEALNAYTCTTVQNNKQTCTVENCKDEKHASNLEIQPLGHILEPIFDKNDVVTYRCMECGWICDDSLGDKGHQFTTKNVKETCVTDGGVFHICGACGLTRTEIIPAAGHQIQTTTIDATCTQDGSIQSSCTVCGDTQTQVMPAAGHDYVGGICTACGEILKPVISLKYPTVLFEEIISINVYYAAADMDAVEEMGVISYYTPVSQADITTADAIASGYGWSEVDGLYHAATAGISAKRLGDELYFAVYAKLIDNSYVYSKIVHYSPATYAYAQLTEGKVAMRPLVVAMLNYGAAAQNYFSYHTDQLVNARLTSEQNAFVEGYRSDMVNPPVQPTEQQCAFFSETGNVVSYRTVSFEGNFEVNYYATPQTEPTGDVTMYYWSAEDYRECAELTAGNATEIIKMEQNSYGQYCATTPGIAAKDLDQAFAVAFSYTDGQNEYDTDLQVYSIGRYCTNQISKNQMVEFAKATSVYGYYAKELFSDAAS